MASIKDLYEYEKKYGGRTAILRDSKGQIVGTTPIDETNKTITPSVSLNKETGTIYVAVPPEYKNSPFVKEYVESMKQLSSLYKTNPDYAFPVYTYNEETGESEDTGETRNIDEQIRLLNGELEDKTGSLQQLIETIRKLRTNVGGTIKRSMQDIGKTAPDLDDEQLWAISTGIGIGEGKSGTSFQLIPDDDEFALFHQLESYDPETGYARIDDIMENVWNRDKVSDLFLKRIRNYLNDYFEKGDFSDVDKFIKMYAMFSFVNGKKPEVHWARGTAETIGSATEAYFITFTKDFTNFFGFVWNLSARNVAGLFSQDAKDFLTYEKDEAVNWLYDGADAFGRELAGKQAIDYTDEHALDKYFDNIAVNNAAAAAGMAVGEFLGFASAGILEAVITGKFVGKVFEGAAGLVGKGAEVAKTLLNGIENAEALSAVGKGLADIAKLEQGAETLGRLYSFFSKASAGISKLGVIFAGSSELTGLTKAISWLINEGLDIIGDIGSDQPELLAEWLSGDVLNDDEKAELLASLNTTLLAHAVFGGGGKLLGATKKSHLYQALNADLTRGFSKVSTIMSNLADKVRLATVGKLRGVDTMQEYIDSFKSARKRSIWNAEMLIRDAKRVVAEADAVGLRKTDASQKALKEFQEKVSELRALYAARTNVRMEGASRIRLWLYSELFPDLKASWKRINDSTKSVLDAEKAIGLKGENIRAGAGRTFSQMTTDYINGSAKIQFLDRYIDLHRDGSGKLKEAIAERKILQGWIDEFNKNASAELKAAANEYIANLKTFWRDFNDMRVREGLISREEIMSDRNSLLWGDAGVDYVRTQRKSQKTKAEWVKADGTVNRKVNSVEDRYDIGAKEHFVDPYISMVAEIQSTASQASRLDFARKYLTNQGIAAKVGGEDSKLLWQSKEIKQARSTLSESVNNQLDGLVENFERSGAIEDIFSNKKSLKAFDVKGGYTPSASHLGTLRAELDDTAIDQLYAEHYDIDAVDFVTGNNTNGVLDLDSFGEQTQITIKNSIDKYYDAHSWERPRRYTVDDFRASIQYDGSVAAYVKRALVLDNADAVNSNLMARLVEQQRKQNRKFNRSTLCVENTRRLRKALQSLPEGMRKSLGDVDRFMDQLLDDLVESLSKDNNIMTQVNRIVQSGRAANRDVAMQYFIMDTIVSDIEKGKNSSIIKKMNDSIKKQVKGKDLSVDTLDDLQKSLTGLLGDVATGRRDTAFTALRGQGDGVIDNDKFMARTRELNQEIKGLDGEAGSGQSVVAIPNYNGQEEYFIVDDTLAEYVFTAPRGEDMKLLQKVNFLWAKAFRFGTTAIRLASMTKQTFTDTLNAIVGGGMYGTFGRAEAELTELFGSDVAKYMSQYTPDVAENLIAKAGINIPAEKTLAQVLEESPEAVENLARAMAQMEAGAGRLASPAATEFSTYQLTPEARAARYAGNKNILTTGDQNKVISGIKKVKDAIKNPHDIREQALRSITYANNLSAGLRNGMSLREARTLAEFTMQEGTTNFWNAMKHLDSINSWVPYLGSSVNGTKSFWRLLSLDPMGVFGRMFNNAILPTMALTAHNLADPRNREAYQKLPEYMKSGNFVIVSEGQVFFIPLPYEMSAFISPWRQVVESLYGAQNYSFWELALNDLVSFSPIDLTGFTDPDYNRLLSNGGVWDRLGMGFSRTAAQIMPPTFRTMFIAATRKDPYTGADIRNQYEYYDYDTGTIQTVDYSSGQMAKAVASVTKGFIDAALAQEMLEGLFGSQVVEYVDFVTNLAMLAAGNEAAQSWDTSIKNILEDAISPLIDYERKSRAEVAWTKAVSALYDEKYALINSDAWQSYLTAYSRAKAAGNETELRKLAAVRKNLTDQFYQKVFTMVNNLNSEYGAEFTGYKLASVISLMTMYLNTGDASTDNTQWSMARSQAIETMVQMGFPSPTDPTALGYINKDYNKSLSGMASKVTSMNPLTFLDMENKMFYSGNLHQENIERILKKAGLTRSNMFEDYNKATTKAAKKKARADWNAKVVKALAPYIQQYGIDAVLYNRATVDMLDEYFFITGSNSKAYLKSIFKEY